MVTAKKKRKLSGEIFKEKETDILQTSLEQIAFYLESHKTTDSQLYKSTLWKKLRTTPNRRLPYFTKTRSSLASCFSSVTRKFSMPYLQSNSKRDFHNSSCLQILLPYFKESRHIFLISKLVQSTNFGTKHVKQNKGGFVRTCKKIFKCQAKSTIWPSKKVSQISHLANHLGTKKQDLIFMHAFLLRSIAMHFRTNLLVSPCFAPTGIGKGEGKGYKSTYKSTICTCSANKYKLKHALSSRDALVKRSFVSAKNQKTSFRFTIKIGDYLSSGDQIGEKSISILRTDAKRTFASLLSPLSSPHTVKKAHTDTSRPPQYPYPNKGIGSDTPSFVRDARQPIVLSSSGRVLAISKSILILQKTQPVLFYNSASLHVKKGEWVSQGSPILTLTHQTLITGDIVQGIPRIEQLFEAFTSPPPAFKDKRGLTKFKDVHDTLHSQVRDIFRKYWLKNVLPIAVRKSLEEIGYILVEMIQKVYLSQGVLIADKHIEIIIRQIASKGQILDSGSTGLFLEEILPIQQIENANLTTAGKKCLYVPAVMGLTAAALNSDSFISAASFQETTRVLSRDAVVGKSDFLRGLKEKVVIGDLISAGTGLDIYFIYNTMNIAESGTE